MCSTRQAHEAVVNKELNKQFEDGLFEITMTCGVLYKESGAREGIPEPLSSSFQKSVDLCQLEGVGEVWCLHHCLDRISSLLHAFVNRSCSP